MTADIPSVAEWSAAYARVPSPVADAVDHLVGTHKAALAVAFYRDLMALPEAARLISPVQLNNRLLPAIQRWMQILFDPLNATHPLPTIALQRHVGELHARAGIPLDMVGQGFRGFKREFNALLSQADLGPDALVPALVYGCEITDLALAEMQKAQTLSTAGSTPRAAPPAAAAKAADVQGLLVSMEAERRQQMGALTDEESRFLQSMLSSVAQDDVKSLGTSPFGMWLQHKAPLLFEDTSETASLTQIAQALDHLDSVVLPRLRAGQTGALVSANDQQLLLREVVAGLQHIRALVNGLFDRVASADGYRDGLTQLFNRSLLASILRRELDLARRKRSTFSVLLVNIDHFNELSQAHGRGVSDRVLQHVATVLSSQVRSSDFVFRYGEEEFLIVLVELDAEQSMAVADKLRRTVENADIPLAPGRSLQVTLSLGVALCDGQEDPQSITALAGQALGMAKGAGRNRACLAES